VTDREKRNENKESKAVAVPSRAQPWKKLAPVRNEASEASRVDRNFALWSSLKEKDLV